MTTFSKTPTGPSQRQLKVGEQIRHIMSEVLARSDFHNEVLARAHVCIGEVRMSPDLRHARAYITSLMGESMSEAVKALNENEYHFRKTLSQELTMKFLPKVCFVEDDSFHEANKINALFTSDRVSRDLDAETDSVESSYSRFKNVAD